MNTPSKEHTTDEQFEQLQQLIDADQAQAFEHADVPSIFAKPSKPAPEHPKAADLYRRFRAGSALMTSIEAYQIGDELNAQLGRIHELEAEIALKVEEARATVARLVSEIRELRGTCAGCEHDGQDCCLADSPGRIKYSCTRAAGHDGEHIACGEHACRLMVWPADEPPLPARDRETEGQIDDELARGAGK